MYRRLVAIQIIALLAALVTMLDQQSTTAQRDPFTRIWERTDYLVELGLVNRTWMWGPQRIAQRTYEPYLDSPGEERLVIYFDKSRMEINNPDAPDDGLWYVTNGLLVMEMVTGVMQIGDSQFDERSPAEVVVAGDLDDPAGPTYLTMALVLDAAPVQQGQTIIQRLNRDGTYSDDPSMGMWGVTAANLVDVPGLRHRVASPFWEFMNSSGPVFRLEATDQIVEDRLFENPYYATGLPITEAYWAQVKVGGTYRDVLMQCFERRCLTYTPDNPPGWQVEAGNVGLHYYRWRYGVDRPKPMYVDLGDPASEVDFTLQGWSGIHGPPENETSSPSGDLTVRFQQLRADNVVIFPEVARRHGYLITTEVGDGGCSDNFKILVNGVELYSYTADSNQENVAYRHDIHVPASLVTSSDMTVTFRNTSIDDCGLAGVFNVKLEPVLD